MPINQQQLEKWQELWDKQKATPYVIHHDIVKHLDKIYHHIGSAKMMLESARRYERHIMTDWIEENCKGMTVDEIVPLLRKWNETEYPESADDKILNSGE